MDQGGRPGDPGQQRVEGGLTVVWALCCVPAVFGVIVASVILFRAKDMYDLAAAEFYGPVCIGGGVLLSAGLLLLSAGLLIGKAFL